VGIVDEDIVRVRESTDIVAVVSQHLQLKRSAPGGGLCPFTPRSRRLSRSTPSRLYYCFGCQAKATRSRSCARSST